MARHKEVKPQSCSETLALANELRIVTFLIESRFKALLFLFLFLFHREKKKKEKKRKENRIDHKNTTLTDPFLESHSIFS